MTENRIKKLLTENYPLLAILIGIFLISVSVGPFMNDDTVWEFEAASGVIRWGMPYAFTFGNMMNQPPLGFYVEALFFILFGSSMNNGVVLISLMGLGSIVTVYKIGNNLYDKPTGLVAAGLFALSPWEIILSRTFLIDVQCLFFSLLCLLAGIYSLQKDSVRLFFVSGILFGIAFLTKFFAVFMLPPIILLLVHYQKKKLRNMLIFLGVFFLPVFLFSVLWYQIISGQGLLSIFSHNDFEDYNSSGIIPSYFFVGYFLLNYGLGFFFVGAVIFSLLVCFLRRKLFSKILVFDLIFLATILLIIAVTTFLGAGFNLKSPYCNAIKYAYQSLPFFSLLAASLVSKNLLLFHSAKTKRKLLKTTYFSAIFIGLFLLGSTILVNICYSHLLSKADYLLFRVEPSEVLGYSLFNPTPTGEHSLYMFLQYLGFFVVLSGFLWASRHKIAELTKRLPNFRRC